MIDTHCHLTYPGLFERVDAVIQDAHQAGVHQLISVSTHIDDAHKAHALTQLHDGVFSTAGIHPHYAADCPDQQAVTQMILQLADQPKVVAIGEIGLDLHYPDPPLADQQRLFDWQLQAASQLKTLPIIIHNRKATAQTLAMLKASGLEPTRFVFHCFTGQRDELDAILAFGAHVSFTGIVTFNSAKDIAACAKCVPIDRFMIETDSPYLTPQPHRKVRPNEPKYVTDVARFLASLLEMPLSDWVDQVDQNARAFFKLPKS